MTTQLLDYYNRELRYVRELGGEFAREFPKVASRLGLDAFDCADPYVERLLEGFAFMAARVQLEIDAQFPRFTEQMLEVLCPHYLGPTPSMTVLQLEPAPEGGGVTEGFRVPRGTAVRTRPANGESARCEYRTGHDVTLWPIELKAASHTSRVDDLPPLALAAGRAVKGALRLTLRTTHGQPFSSLGLDSLPLFVRGNDAASMRLLELLLCASAGVFVRPAGEEKYTRLAGASVEPMGIDDDEALLPCGPRGFQGYRLLHEFFAFPSRLAFARLAKIGAGVRACRGRELEVVIALDRYDATLEQPITPGHLALFCTPAINLFPKTADRIPLSDREHEFHVVADRTRPLDFEVHSIVDVKGYGTNGEAKRTFSPLYGCRPDSELADPGAFFTVHRAPRRVASSHKGRAARTSYLGGEVFVSLVDGQGGPFQPDIRQLGVATLCTNRDLPLYAFAGGGAPDFFLESGAPVKSVVCVAGPSAPRPAHASGTMAWRLISHLSLNYLSLTDGADGSGASSLRELLSLYADPSSASSVRQIDGLRSARGGPVLRKLPLAGPPSFGRGTEITLECDDGAFEGSSVVLLGLVLSRFLARYASINSFTETVLRSAQRGEIMRWPPVIGSRPTV